MFSGHLNVCCSDVSYSNPACLLFCGSNYIVHKGLGLQWRSEYQTSSVFKWLRGWMPNGPVFKCHLNTEPFEIRTSKSLVFKCFQYSNCQYSDPHCTLFIKGWVYWVSSQL